MFDPGTPEIDKYMYEMIIDDAINHGTLSKRISKKKKKLLVVHLIFILPTTEFTKAISGKFN